MNRRNNGPTGGQNGFIPMIIMIILVLVGVMFFAFQRVMQVQQ